MGQKRRFDRRPATSGLPRSADIRRVRRHVSKVPGTDPPALRDRLREAILEPAECALNVVVGLNKPYNSNNGDRLKGNLL